MNGFDITAPFALLSKAQRDAIAAEIEALDAWRDAKCAAIRIRAPETDAGEFGCSVDYHGEGEHDGDHHPDCPVAVARVALFAATDRRRVL